MERFVNYINVPIFRAKALADTKWVYGYPIGRCKMILENSETAIEIDSNTLGQFIGVNDCNGIRIFDGDFITAHGKYPKLVRFIPKKCSFCLANIDNICNEIFWDIWQQPDESWWLEMEVKVIGNIIDNPKILENEKSSI